LQIAEYKKTEHAMTDTHVAISEQVHNDEESIEHDSNLNTSMLYNNVENQITSKAAFCL